MVVGDIAIDKDVVIIGGGPAGYTAAIKAAQLGREVTLIEKEKLGGVCLNHGCIPAKIFSTIAAKYKELHHYSTFGIQVEKTVIVLNQLHQYQQKIISQLEKGIEQLCKNNHVEIIKGNASFLANDRIGVEKGDTFEMITFQKAIIATGCQIELDKRFLFHYDQKQILNPFSLYKIEEIPDHLVIYGSDYIALEAAFTFKLLGAKVSLILENGEKGFGLDESLEKELKRLFKKEKIHLLENFQLIDAKLIDGKVQAKLRKNSLEEVTMECSHLYIEPNYKPNLKDLGIERLAIEQDENGFIKINNYCQTTKNHIYAIGDVTDSRKYAFCAIKQGKTAAEAIAGCNVDWQTMMIPQIIHTYPPIASVGLTEEEAQQLGYKIHIGLSQYRANGFASVMNKRDGLIKIISEQESERILGVHMIGSHAIELISTAITALELVARNEDLKFPLYPHPSFNEVLLEAIENVSSTLTKKENMTF